jgi:uracil-DNA glycosylase
MVKIVFVGDQPSRKNVNDDIAFVGASCFPVVVDWLKKLSPDFYICINSNNSDNLHAIKTLFNNNFKIIALGNKASERLENINVQHFKMPHPSGLNRQLNDQEYVAKMLKNCYNYVQGVGA